MKTKIAIILSVLLCGALATHAQWGLDYFGDISIFNPTPSDLIINGQAYDGMQINVGYEKEANGQTNAVIAKTNGSTVVWERKVPGNSIFYSVIIAANGDYIVVGTTHGVLNWGGDGLICRYSSSGTLLYSRAVHDPSWFLLFTGVCELSNGSIAAVGYENDLNVDYPTAQNAYIEKFTSSLSPIWAKSLTNPNSATPKAIFLSATCDNQFIYVTGYTDNAAHSGLEGTITKFKYSGTIADERSYGVTYTNTEPSTCTLNCLWLLKPVLFSGNLYIWGSITNWGLTGDDAAVMVVNPATLNVNSYTSIHSPTNQWTNPQGISSFYLYDSANYLFTAAPGATQFDISRPNYTAFPPGFVWIKTVRYTMQVWLMQGAQILVILH